MGNTNNRSSAGSSFDFFQTHLTPSEADVTTMAISSETSSHRPQTPSLEMPPHDSHATTFAVTDWAQRLSPPSEWAILSVDGSIKSPNVSGEVAGHDEAPVVSLCSLTSLNSSRVWPLEQSWQEKDSGLEPQAAAERSGKKLSRALLRLIERHCTLLGLSLDMDTTVVAVELVKQLITERDKLAEEVNSLRETLNNEKSEWQQFQCDLQVAVSVAEGLRAESEQARSQLQEDHKSLQEQLAQALGRELEMQRELKCLRSQHTDVCRRLASLEKQQQPMDRRFTEDKSPPAEGHAMKMHYVMEEADMKSVHKQEEHEANEKMDAKRSANSQLTGKGIVKVYVDALEKKKGERDPRRSLSRIPLPVDSSCHNNNLIKTSSTLPQCKKEEPPQGRKMAHIFKRHDSWSSCHTVVLETTGELETSSRVNVHQSASRLEMDAVCTKPPLGKLDDAPSDIIKPANGLCAQLRRHGGSKRNSLLSWCQSRTEGYQYIEITNFSTCWQDGLAFCAVYHTYLPTRIPYNRLDPAEKKENLDLAFKTGESVGITTTLSVEEMLKEDGPEWQKVLCYVESIFHHFVRYEVASTQGYDCVSAI
ncbi:cytospin-A-like isoform X2 [Phyllopteryx taeniolatus]|uniref:cytospin-A-like isoform X2 n=1 Tax=Phyllopteryx taeniolatus TaxID=161469 RepID=UPI002AD215FE|nr:cytospin-A-like isoform X2 [Phyllopteryx taeniolatus]